MINVENYIKERIVKEVPMVHLIIEINTDHPFRTERWTYINNTDWDSEIEDMLYKENMKDIELNTYQEYDKDAVVSFRFVNINDKKLEDFKELVDEIGQYIYDIRKGKNKICTVNEVQIWLKNNLEDIVNKYR